MTASATSAGAALRARGGTVLLTWDPVCQRSDSLAAELGVELRTVHFLWYRRPWIAPLKYALQAVATLAWLLRRRPAVVVVTNPPPFAPLVAWLYCAGFGAALVIDAHTGPFLEPKWRPFLPLTRWLARRAALNLVTNTALQQRIEAWGGSAFVLPDPLPHLAPAAESVPLDPTAFNVFAIFSFYEDEPVDALLAVRALPPDLRLYVSGDHTRVPAAARARVSPQLHFTGFLPRATFDALLSQCDAVMVLCLRPHTLLCGAYEAAAAGKPLLTSQSEAMRAHFRGGTLFCGNATAEIEAGLAALQQQRAALAAEMRDTAHALRADWRHTCAALLAALRGRGVAAAELPAP